MFWDEKLYNIFDGTAMILIGEEKLKDMPISEFKVYIEKKSKEFFIEINEKTDLKYFSKSTLLNILNFAKNQGSSLGYVCFSK